MINIDNFDTRCKKLQQSKYELSLRESQTLIMTVFNMANKEISVELGISESAIREFKMNARLKTCCKSNEAMIFALSEYLR